ncbi:MAG TPA: hydantoinase/oxoprolinase family protein [Solirubrobacteraceae bacterium]|nr:hydantoinase/oxoprolinase family protein [Solirubrobacteraceae bacterium]
MRDGLLAVDVGGTFTDVIGIRDGRIEAVKVASRRQEVEQAVLDGALALGVRDRRAFNHASTVGLNAVLTRRLPKVALLTSYGHRDVLDIARCWRPAEALTDPDWRRSFGDAAAPLVPRYLRRGIRERIAATGEQLIALDEEQARTELERLKRCEVEGVAVCLINAYANPAHERRLLELVTDVLGADVACSISSSVSALAKEFQRAATTVVDVLMKLIYERYTAELEQGLRAEGFEGELNFADSAATLLEAGYAMRRPFRLVFSGPAAGAVASAHFGRLIGDEQLLCCDVGGTSSDISVVNGGEPQLNSTFALEQDLFINALSVELGSLGAGGGSVIAVTGAGEIRVGPESAGADPGPACYGRGGTAPTMTDAFLAIGLLDPDRFNAGRMRLDPELTLEAFRRLESPLSLDQRIGYAYRMGLNNIAEGLIDVAIARGLDPRDFSLMAFGAAGPLMLPAILDRVRARRVIVPPLPGLFSALGLLSTNRVYTDSASSYTVLSPAAAAEVAGVFERIEADLRAQLPAGEEVAVRRRFDGRLAGQSWETPFIAVPDGPIDAVAVERMIASFHDEYEARYGNRFAAIPVQSVTYRVQLISQAPKVSYPELAPANAHPEPDRILELRYLDDANRRAGEYERERLRTGQLIHGPAIIREPMSTTHVVAGQQAVVGAYGELLIEGVSAR